MCLRHILFCISIMANLSLCGLDFLNLCALGTFYLAPLSWWISLYIGQIFLTHKSQVHFILCLYCGGFLLYRSDFSDSCASSIFLSCAFIMIDFSLCELSFFDSHTSGISYLVPLPWWISLYIGRVFLTHASRAYFILCSIMINFSLRRLGFLDSCAFSIFYLVLSS